LPLSDIVEDPEIQPREAINPATVHHYAELMRDGVQFPPLDVFGDEHLLAGGYQRLSAARSAGSSTIKVRIHAGTRRDAILFAIADNAKHGLPMSNSDKRRIVTRMLQDPEWSGWSSNAIAKHCGCGHKLVDTVRAELASSLAPGASEMRNFRTKHGKTSKMKTGRIGKSRPKPAPAEKLSETASPSITVPPQTAADEELVPEASVNRRAKFPAVNGEPCDEDHAVNIVATEPPPPPLITPAKARPGRGSGSSITNAIEIAARLLTDLLAQGIKADPTKVAELLRKKLSSESIHPLVRWLDQFGNAVVAEPAS